MCSRPCASQGPGPAPVPGASASGSFTASAAPRVGLDMAGGHGGAPDELWRAEGKFELARGGSGELHLRADRFSFAKLAPILAGTPVLHPENTSLDATVDVAYDPGQVTFD